jgi:hypothetical protein
MTANHGSLMIFRLAHFIKAFTAFGYTTTRRRAKAETPSNQQIRRSSPNPCLRDELLFDRYSMHPCSLLLRCSSLDQDNESLREGRRFTGTFCDENCVAEPKPPILSSFPKITAGVESASAERAEREAGWCPCSGRHGRGDCGGIKVFQGCAGVRVGGTEWVMPVARLLCSAYWLEQPRLTYAASRRYSIFKNM